jgi:hypothetical protein
MTQQQLANTILVKFWRDHPGLDEKIKGRLLSVERLRDGEEHPGDKYRLRFHNRNLSLQRRPRWEARPFESSDRLTEVVSVDSSVLADLAYRLKNELGPNTAVSLHVDNDVLQVFVGEADNTEL